MRSLPRKALLVAVGVLALAATSGCTTEEPPTQGPESQAESQEADGRVGAVSRRDLTLSFTLDAITHNGGEGEGNTGIEVAAGLTPIQYLRFTSLSFSGRATVETIMGQRQFDCVELSASSASDADSETVASLDCALPRSAETVAGLRAKVTITSDTLRDVLTAPNLFIGYDETADQYYVNVVSGDGHTKTPVKVGITDGVVRVITEGVVGGEELAPIAGDS